MIPYLESESPVLKIRKHWIILVRNTGATVIGGLLPIAVLGGLILTGYLPTELVPFVPFLALLLSLWVLVTWLSLCVMWTDYYLDIWIVTNRRIINVEQLDLFNRRITSWNLQDIREVSVHVENVVQTFFSYGTLTIETAGSGTDAHETVEGIPHPEHVRELILTSKPPRTTAPPAVPGHIGVSHN